MIIPDHRHAVACGRCPAYFAFLIISCLGGQETVFIGIFIFGHSVSVFGYLFVKTNILVGDIVIILVISISVFESAITVGKRLVVDPKISYGYIIPPFIALVNQQLASQGKPPIGFLNPTIYSENVTSAYSTGFHDVTSGTSGSFSAVTGYDLVTGWGSPKPGLINELAP